VSAGNETHGGPAAGECGRATVCHDGVVGSYLTTVTAAATLFPGEGSGVDLDTDTAPANRTPLLADDTVTEKLTSPSLANDPVDTDAVCTSCPDDTTTASVDDTTVTSRGNTSDDTTSRAAAGPLFFTVTR